MTTLHDEIKPLSCPFCGRSDLLGFESHPENGFIGVRCRACGRIGPAGRSESEREASINWNNRHAAAELAIASDARIAALEAALQKIIDMNVQYCRDKYGDATKAESMSCVSVARNALKGQP